MEDKESLETCALVSKLPDTVQDQIDNLLTNGVVTTSIVVGSIFLPGDQLFRVEELAVSASTYLVCKTKIQRLLKPHQD